MQPRAVSAAHGWAWITQGYALFRRSPLTWVGLLLLLFAAANVLMRVPLLGIVFVLLMPIFIVGLMEGCSALERGQPLQIGYLLAGFRKNAAQLVTIGGLTLMGNLLVMMIVVGVGGEPLAAMMKAVQQGAPLAPQMEAEASAAVRRALLVGIAVSVPLLMALWYAPLLVYFNDMGPIAALKSSFVACLRNMAPMLVYGAAIFAGMFIVLFAMLIARRAGLVLGPYDLALWVLTPIVLPSIYASYRDIYAPGAAEPRPDSVPS